MFRCSIELMDLRIAEEFALADLVPNPIARVSEMRDEPRRADDNAALSWLNGTGKCLVLHMAKALGTDDVAATEWSKLVLVDRTGVGIASARAGALGRAGVRQRSLEGAGSQGGARRTGRRVGGDPGRGVASPDACSCRSFSNDVELRRFVGECVGQEERSSILRA
jgi:hypothetical protein